MWQYAVVLYYMTSLHMFNSVNYSPQYDVLIYCTLLRWRCDHTCPVGGVWELFAALDRLHGVGEGRAGFGAVEQSAVERVDEHLGRGDGNRPQRHQHTLSSSRQESPGQTHHPVCCYFTVRLLVRAAGSWKHTLSSPWSSNTDAIILNRL